MYRLIIFFALVVAMLVTICDAQKKKSKIKDSNEILIDELVAVKDFPLVYVEDGAADGTVLDLNRESSVYPKPQHPTVEAILKLKSAAIPLLIRHLDDTRFTSVSADVGVPWVHYSHVPVGVLCLDILTKIVNNDSRFIDDESASDDGLGSGLKLGFYFRPDDYLFRHNEANPKAIVLIVKRNLLKLYKRGLLRYRCSPLSCSSKSKSR